MSFLGLAALCFVTIKVIIQHPLELLMSGSRGRTSGETALSAHSEEHEVF